jgi:hypothetical protein
LASNIGSHYVYLAGPVGSVVQLGIWDATTGAFVTSGNVCSDLDPSASVFNQNQTAAVAVDALDRICVAYQGLPANTGGYFVQIMARVLKFDGANVTYLTPTFFPFLNADNAANVAAHGVLGFNMLNPAVAMTTRQICIAGMGIINSVNNPALGPDVTNPVNVYTVINHPAPVAAPRPVMTISSSGGNVTISWLADDGLFTLQSTTPLEPTAWANVSPQPATSGPVAGLYSMTVPIGSGRVFFRLAR